MNSPAKTIDYLDRTWPFTGRIPPAGAELKVINLHAAWDDLMWYDAQRDLWVYISTLPHGMDSRMAARIKRLESTLDQSRKCPERPSSHEA